MTSGESSSIGHSTSNTSNCKSLPLLNGVPIRVATLNSPWTKDGNTPSTTGKQFPEFITEIRINSANNLLNSLLVSYVIVRKKKATCRKAIHAIQYRNIPKKNS